MELDLWHGHTIRTPPRELAGKEYFTEQEVAAFEKQTNLSQSSSFFADWDLDVAPPGSWTSRQGVLLT